MESILHFLDTATNFTLGAIAGAATVFFTAVLAYSGIIFMQQKDLKRLKKQNENLEEENKLLNDMIVDAHKENLENQEYLKRLKEINNGLSVRTNRLEAEVNKMYVEVDALKAQYFPAAQGKVEQQSR